jgi:hypothetical protein
MMANGLAAFIAADPLPGSAEIRSRAPFWHYPDFVRLAGSLCLVKKWNEAFKVLMFPDLRRTLCSTLVSTSTLNTSRFANN